MARDFTVSGVEGLTWKFASSLGSSELSHLNIRNHKARRLHLIGEIQTTLGTARSVR